MEKEICVYDSPEAATQKTVTLWFSRNGRAYDNEHIARYDGCTHMRCDCGKIKEKCFTACDDCQEKLDKERYLKMPVQDWDGKTPLRLFDSDRYFFDEESIDDYCEDMEIKKEDIQLIICEPCFAEEIDPNEYYCDDLPDDGCVPKEIEAAFSELNKKIKKYKKPLSWFQGKYRTTLK